MKEYDFHIGQNNNNKYKYVNLALQASGILGISYAGATKYLYEKGFRWNNIVGASSGSLVGSLLAAGYTPDELELIVMETDFGALVGDLKLPLDEILALLLSQNGVYTWDKFEAWLYNLLAAKDIYTFGDLLTKGVVKEFNAITSDITRGNSVILPDDLNQYNIRPLSYLVSKGVRMSAAIPYFFTPVVLEFNGSEDYMSDGGLLYDYPVNFYDDRNNSLFEKIPTIGIRLMPGSVSLVPQSSLSLIQYTSQFFASTSANNYAGSVIPQNVNRSIFIETMGISPLAFDLTNEQKTILMQNGYDAAKAFIEFGCNKYEVI